MKKERILSHKMSQRLTFDEISGVSASGTSNATVTGTYSSQTGADVTADVNIDM